jgi:hypothetical protein
VQRNVQPSAFFLVGHAQADRDRGQRFTYRVKYERLDDCSD